LFLDASLRGASGQNPNLPKGVAMQQTERKPLVDLGQVVATPGALDLLDRSAGREDVHSLQQSVRAPTREFVRK